MFLTYVNRDRQFEQSACPKIVNQSAWKFFDEIVFMNLDCLSTVFSINMPFTN